MANITVLNTSANLSSKTLLAAENANTITGLLTYDRDPSAPFAVSASSAVVTNLDADKLDGQHAPTGTIVGTSDSQTLTNKSIDLASNTLTGTTAQFNTALSDANFATQAGSETLTNKTIALGSNTVSGTIAQFNTALSDGDFATLGGSETLTNKTIALGSNTVSFTLAQFNTALSDDNFAALGASNTFTGVTQKIDGATNAVWNADRNTTSDTGALLLQTNGATDWYIGQGVYASGSTLTFGNASTAFMSLSTAGILTLSTNGETMRLTPSTSTSAIYIAMSNSSGTNYVGREGTAGGAVFTGSSAAAMVLGTANTTNLEFATDNTVRMVLSTTGNLTLSGYLAHTTVTSTAASATTNNADPSNAGILRFTGSPGAWTLTGVSGGVNGRVLYIINDTNAAMTLAEENASSDATNRIAASSDSNKSVYDGRGCVLVYSTADNRWRLMTHAF